MKRLTTAASVILLAGSSFAWAASTPLGLSGSLRGQDHVQTQHFIALDTHRLAGEDALNEALGQPPRFAIAHPAQISSVRSGTWDEIDGTSVWRYRVTAEESASFNFGFSRYHLPADAQLYLYSADGSIVAGPYTARHNAPHGEFWTPIIAAKDVVIELNVPTHRRGQVMLELASINQGYRGFGTALKGYQQPELDFHTEAKTGSCKAGELDENGEPRSGACNTDVMCLSDDDIWQDQRRSAGAYSRNGIAACSGSLVNNTANDRRMLFITATHCGVTAASAPSMVVYWNYEWPVCRRPGASGGTSVNPPDPNQASSGATFLAATTNPFTGGGCTVGANCSDVTLVEMNQPANPDFNHYWAGWDRTNPARHACPGNADPNATEGMCAGIHHPGVDEKRITFSETDLVTGNIAAGVGVHWRVEWDLTPPELPNFPAGGPLPVSVTEGGSSGSPLYNADQRLVGVLSGGLAACGAPSSSQYDLYGKISHAWDGLGTANTRIRDYLDPLTLAPDTWDGIGMAPFTMSVDPSTINVCATVGSVDIDIDIGLAEPGFSDPVTLSYSGIPTGASAALSVNPVTPPGTSVLTIGNLASATTGSYAVDITATAGDVELVRLVPFQLSSGTPAASAPQTPANGASGVSSNPTLTWSSVSGAANYRVEVSTSSGFGTTVLDQVVTGTSVQAVGLSGSTTYYWRVTAQNFCGNAAPSATFSFTTQGAPGDCGIGVTPTVLFSESFSSGNLGGFSTTGSVGAQTWAATGSAPAGSPSGGAAALAVNIGSVSDQRLISPPVLLPSDASSLTLQFWNHQHMESSTGADPCWDGGLLEVSTDAGGTWTQVDGPAILNRAYDGSISGSFSNPLAGMRGWCGDPRAWENYIIDLDAYAGQAVQFRWRLGTDSSLTRPGWHLDDIKVQACGGTVPEGADLGLALFDVPDPAQIGGELTFVGTVGNFGPAAASGVQIEIDLPPELSLVTARTVDVEKQLGTRGAAWSCVASGASVTCDLSGSLPALAMAPNLELVTAVSGAANPGVVLTHASVSSNGTDPNPGNNDVVVETTIDGQPDAIFGNDFECYDGLDGCAPPVDPNIVVIDGINFVPVASGTGGSILWKDGTTCACDTAPYSLNVYQGTVAVQFFWPNNANASEGGVTLTGSAYAVLQSGATIGGSSQFLMATTAGNAAAWYSPGNVDGYLGFRFLDGGVIKYGYAHITTGANGRPFTIHSVAYNDVGDPITIP